ncbi:MAG: hypothetical protein U0T75_06510 [Chitinophagales bacterium]
MKKGFVVVLAVAGFAALTTTSCGEKYTPLTQEQITAQADSLAGAQKDAKLQALKDECQKDLDAKVSAKVEELRGAATSAEAK